MYFSSAKNKTGDKYQFLKDTVKKADKSGFKAIWIPDRRTNAIGGIVPNSAQLCGAMAMITEKIRLRSGSVILPLHHPIELAEEMSVADNLSNGRVDLSVTTKGDTRDFITESHSDQLANDGIKVFNKLWAGKEVSYKDNKGELKKTTIDPAPVQNKLNIWITCGGKNKERFAEAGARGYNVLTALLIQSDDELRENIQIYREARAANGLDPHEGIVSLMVHTFVGETDEKVKSIVKEPFTEYIASSVQQWSHMSRKVENLDEYDREKMLDYAFEQYFHSAALFGSVANCKEKMKGFKKLGINELACLIDFGPSPEEVMGSLELLSKLIKLSGIRAVIS